MKMIGNVSDWLSYAGGALIKVADSAGSTVFRSLLFNLKSKEWKLCPLYFNKQLLMHTTGL